MKSFLKFLALGATLILLAALASAATARAQSMPSMPSIPSGSSASSASSSGDDCSNSPVPQDTRVSIGQQLCQTNTDKSDANDPCNMARLDDDSQKNELGVAITYSALTAECGLECASSTIRAGIGSGALGCKWMTIEVSGAEALDSIILWAATKGDIQQMETSIGMAGTTALGVVAAKAGTSGGSSAAATASSAGKTVADKNTSMDSASTDCVLLVTNGLQSAGRWFDYAKIRGDMQNAYAQKWCQATHGLVSGTLSGGASGSTNASSSGAGGVGIKSDLTMNRGSSSNMTVEEAQAAVQSAASTLPPDQQKILSQVQKDTGVSPLQATMSALTGASSSPLAAYAAGGSMPNNAKEMLAKVDSGSGRLVQAHKSELEAMMGHQPQFASAGSNNAIPKEANPLAGFSDMMAQLLPGQKKGQAQQTLGATGVDYGTAGGSRGIASERTYAASQGLHGADDSLFEVTSTRYHSIMIRFLNGETLVTDPNAAGALPANPYLSQ